MFDVDFVQRIKVTGLFFLQFYKIVTGTMLTLFIPQNCDGEICSLNDNFKNDEPYHQMALCWNSMTLIGFLILYVYELKRENWSIEYLDIDNNKPDNALKSIIIKEKKLDKRMDELNLYYYRIVNFTIFMNMVNLGLLVKILYDDYHSQSTISCAISFTLLIWMKLYNSFDVAYQSVKYDKMKSAYMSEFVSYNVLDSDYLLNKVVENKSIKVDELDDLIIPKKI
jgi:hypothetical protein